MGGAKFVARTVVVRLGIIVTRLPVLVDVPVRAMVNVPVPVIGVNCTRTMAGGPGMRAAIAVIVKRRCKCIGKQIARQDQPRSFTILTHDERLGPTPNNGTRRYYENKRRAVGLQAGFFDKSEKSGLDCFYI